MKKCPKCQKEHCLTGKFCSRSCANSRKFSDESKLKKKLANKSFYESLNESLSLDEKIIRNNNIRKKYDYDEQQRQAKETKLKQSWERPYEEMGQSSLRKRILHERNYRCECCGQTEEWQGKLLVLELDHIDGNNKNNSPNNLRILCPNCHSQTTTFRARNMKKGATKLDLVLLEQNLRIHKFATPALRAMNLSNSPKRMRIAKEILDRIRLEI